MVEAPAHRRTGAPAQKYGSHALTANENNSPLDEK
jgi:hypothetical protein